MRAAIQEILRTGRDPNDSSWLVTRYGEDWARAKFDETLFDATRNVVELAPASLVFGPDTWLPLNPVTDRLGNAYRADRSRHLLLRKGPCETVFTPVEGIGGQGWETGRFDHPTGVTVDCRGWLLIADAGNHRVQVVEPGHPSTIAVLGKVDLWGRYIAGSDAGAMQEPVHAVCNPETFEIFVADRAGGLIHVFDDRFEYARSFRPTTLPASASLPGERRPVAITIAEDGSLWVLDTGYSRIMRMTTEGVALPDVGVPPNGLNPFPGGRTLQPRYATAGEVTVGPIDSGVYDQTWHKISIEGELPEGTGARLQSFASNEAGIAPEAIPWAPIEPVTITPDETRSHGGLPERLVLSDIEAWRRERHGEYVRSMPDLYQFTGRGPQSSDNFELPLRTARMLHVGDVVSLDTGPAKESLTVSGMSSTTMRAYSNGDARVFPAGTKAWLETRDGAPVPGGPRLLYTLGSTETLDLSAAPMNDRLTEITLPHRVGALVRLGDRIVLRDGAAHADLEIETIDVEQPITITTDAATGGDFSRCNLRLVRTNDRLVCATLSGFDHQPPRQVSITVDYEHVAEIALVEPDVNTIWLEPGSTVNFDQWARFTTPAAVPTDRGRYLWVRLHLVGALRRGGDETAIATPTVHSIGALTPRPSYLQMLPALYSRSEPDKDPVGGLFLERFLALFEGRLTEMEAAYERLSTLLNIESTDHEWLQFLSTWMGLVLDPSWSVSRRRQLLLEVMDLYQTRGTPYGLSRFLEIYTGKAPIIIEGFQNRPATSLVVGRVGRLGCGALNGDACDFEYYAHRFALHVFIDATAEPDVAETTVRTIIDTTKPAHADYDLLMALPETRVGHQSRVGIDMVLADRPVERITLTSETDTDTSSVLGQTSLNRNPMASDRAGGRTLSQGGIPSRGFTLN